jgi:hypothetical protein
MVVTPPLGQPVDKDEVTVINEVNNTETIKVSL